jgi:hypothetical protein
MQAVSRYRGMITLMLALLKTQDGFVAKQQLEELNDM